MDISRLREKIVEFTKTDWKKYPTYEHALQEWVEGLLKEENADLKCECRRCIHTDCPCILSDFGKDRNGICDHFEDVFDENVELKEELNYSKTHCLFHSDCPTQKELADIKLKVEALEGQSPWKDIKDKSEVIGKLSKAKEIIKELLNSCFGYNSKTVNYEVKAKAEQFLKEKIE